MSSSAEQPTFLTTREVAELLRVRERKVYELVAANNIPCRRVSGKLLFPRRDIENWLGVAGGAGAPAPLRGPLPNVVAGSHDPLLDWALRASGCGLATMFDGSLDGIERMARGEAALCGLHVTEGDGGWNIRHVDDALGDRPLVLVEWARRRQGLMSAAAAGPVAGGFAALAGRRVALRQPKSGGAHLFDRLAREAGLAEDDIVAVAPFARTETEIAAAVAAGRADTALGLEAMARQFNLAFAPLVEERFDLLVDRRAWFEPAVQVLLSFCRTDAFRNEAAALGGYDVAGQGRVHWNGP